ncbi:helix-turn-helix domain-containing protein [Phreatobacter oligotrophus]|uniref:helix-turn-helix domain-containing protein n=1 Tax=Phreatobacter oligotrophus TaxID=1122261 RepID=UPI001472F554
MSRREAATYLRLSEMTVHRLASAGHIQRVKIGRRALYRREDLDRLIAQGARRA